MTTRAELIRQRQDKLKARTAQDLRPRTGRPVRVVSRMLLDRSGSMSSHAIDLLEGAADYLEAMREQPITAMVAFDLFDDQFEPGPSQLSQQAAYLTEERYSARGDTALFDSILRTIEHAEREENPSTDRVLISIFTDGHDTCSVHDIREVREVVSAKQALGWTFIFGGPNQKVGTDLGIPKDNTFALTGGNIRGVLESMVKRTVTLLLPPKGGTFNL